MLTVTLYYINIKKTNASRKALKKVGIMRINSYNKFFAKVAEIMNTSIKDVEQLDGGYRVKLANHVNLMVFSGVYGSLFIHDHRGIAHIASRYDFEDFKTIKDLYDILVSDYDELVEVEETEEPEEPEEPVKDIIEVKQALNSRFGKEQYVDTDSLQPNKTIIAKIENINHCPNQNTCCIVSPYVHCDYNYKSDDCIKAHKNFIYNCEQVHKHIKATHNPEWHKVSLATLANIDNDMLDEKRRNYMFLYHLIKDFRKYAFEIKREDVYFDLVSNVLRNIHQLYFNNVISYKAYEYAVRHVQVVNVEKGYYSSEREKTFGFKESRRYNATLR
jgi:hypothetical protein